ncbi:MAG: hypothetical protein QOJ99_5817 [Bryobacterales bacterium]|jgi:hypothetical protein|nr:hypothetical protein [Bryobacterales bacterium]
MKSALILIPVLCLCAAAQDADPENSKIEITGSFWSVNSSGSIRANGTPVDLKSDLGVTQSEPTFTGRFVAKFHGRQKILLEGTPFRLTGTRNLTRTITYAGRTYAITEHITSSAHLNYFYGGYQFDLVSRPTGHVGLNLGGAWLNADGTIRGESSGITASKAETIGLPLAGFDWRIFPVRRRVLVEVSGEAKGMALGSYGHYVQASVAAGIGAGPVLIEGGYRIVNVDIHPSNNSSAVSPQFTGPVLSLVIRIP